MIPELNLRAIAGLNRWSSRSLMEIRAKSGQHRSLLQFQHATALETWLRQKRLIDSHSPPFAEQHWTRQLSALISALHRAARFGTVEFFYPPAENAMLFACSDRGLGHLCADAAVTLCQAAQTAGVQNAQTLDGVLKSFDNHLLQLGFDVPVRHIAQVLDGLNVAHRLHPVLAGHYVIGEGRHRIVLDASDTDRTAAMAKTVARNKDLANAILSSYGFPVPHQQTVLQPSEVWAAVRRVGVPAVVKPRMGGRGRGVSFGVKTEHEAQQAFAAAEQVHKEVLVESTVPGQDYRIMVVRDGVIALRSEPPHVVGDGIRSIRELIDVVNADRGLLRGDLHAIEPNGQTQELLAAENRTMDSVLPVGQKQILRLIPDASWIPYDVSKLVHPETRSMLIDVARLIGLDVASIDFRTPDISRSWREVGGGICEVESRAGLWSLLRTADPLVHAFVDHLIEDRPLRIPHIVLVGSGDLAPLDACARELAAGLSADRGWRSGILTSKRLEIAGRTLPEGPLSVAQAHGAIVDCPLVDVGIYVVAADTALAEGFGVARPDLAIIHDEGQSGEIEEVLGAAGTALLSWGRRKEVQAYLNRFDPVQRRASGDRRVAPD